MRDTIRAFIALELSEDVKRALADYVAPLRKLGGQVSWVKPENAHFTLKFLDEVTPQQIQALAEMLTSICRRFAPFEAEVAESGCFPNERHPRVLWVGIREASGKMEELAGQVENACHRMGFAKENRKFSPHVTIARVRQGQAPAIVKSMREQPFPRHEMIFRECTLMKSELHSAGSIYTPLHKFAFVSHQ